MPFKVSAATSTGAISQVWPTAAEALTKVLEHEALGYQKIEVRDDAGRHLTRDQLIFLSNPKDQN